MRIGGSIVMEELMERRTRREGGGKEQQDGEQTSEHWFRNKFERG